MSWLEVCIEKIGAEGCNNNNNNNQVFFGRPQGLWESEFPAGNSFLLRGTKKKTQTLNVVWESCFSFYFEMSDSRLTNRRLVDNGNHHRRSHRASNSDASQRRRTSTYRRCSRVATGAPYPSNANAPQPDADASGWVPTQARAQARTHSRREARLALRRANRYV